MHADVVSHVIVPYLDDECRIVRVWKMEFDGMLHQRLHAEWRKTEIQCAYVPGCFDAVRGVGLHQAEVCLDMLDFLAHGHQLGFSDSIDVAVQVHGQLLHGLSRSGGILHAQLLDGGQRIEDEMWVQLLGKQLRLALRQFMFGEDSPFFVVLPPQNEQYHQGERDGRIHQRQRIMAILHDSSGDR